MPREEIMTGKLEKGLVRANDLVEVEYTDKSKFHKAGDKSKVHRTQAEKLVKDGKATCKAIGGKKKDEGDSAPL